MGGLGRIYPQARIESSTVAVWWVHLMQLGQEHIVAGLDAAVKASPMWMPSAEQVRAAAVEHRHTRERERERERRNARLLGDGGESGYPHVPEVHPGYELAMRWQDESRERGIGPGDTVPADVARRRVQDVCALLDGHVL